MNTISLSIRGVSLALLILATIARADLHTNLPKAGPHFAGLGRLGRDLVRRPSGEQVAGMAFLDALMPPAPRAV